MDPPSSGYLCEGSQGTDGREARGSTHLAARRLLDQRGSSRITAEDASLDSRKAASLVKLLALSSGHRMHREQVLDVLWPELGSRAAANNLRQALHAARRALEPNRVAGSRYLVLGDGSLALCPGGELWVDVEAFEAAAMTARRSRDPAAYRVALELYPGELLPDDRYEEWVETRRRELGGTFHSALIELAGLYGDRGEYRRGVETLQRSLSVEPANEEAHAGLMGQYALSGRQQEALAQYEQLSKVLRENFGTQPGASTRRLRDEIAAGRILPPPTSLAVPSSGGAPDAGGHNLPSRRTSFVGRGREMIEVRRTLSMTRLLTLTGPGGSGKTRLALEVARDLVGLYPDGVWLVELAPLSEPEMVAQEVAGTLGVHEQPGRSFLDSLLDTLGDKQMLLLLDNCEHLIDAATQLTMALLNSCPRIRVLATSRERLGVIGELSWPVPSLSAPGAEEAPTVEELEGYESAMLFADRASKGHPGFELTPDNARAVARVCTQTGGYTARHRACGSEGRNTLRGADLRATRTLPETAYRRRPDRGDRQRTLRATLDWSYESAWRARASAVREALRVRRRLHPGSGRECRSARSNRGRGCTGVAHYSGGEVASGGRRELGVGGTLQATRARQAVRQGKTSGERGSRGSREQARRLLPRPGRRGRAGAQGTAAGGVVGPSGDRARQPQGRALLGARAGDGSGTPDGGRFAPFLVHARLSERGQNVP